MATMPAAPRPRQASVAEWFATEQGLRLENIQAQAVAERLPERPALPLLWLSPHADWPRQRPVVPRLLCLHATPPGWCGDLEGTLPLPLLGESFGTLVLQHPARDDALSMLAEAHRLLLPGGVMWLMVGAATHPARLLHPQHRLWDAPPGGWRQVLRQSGWHLRGIQRLGPAGLGLESASVLLEVEKRTVAMIGPRPTRRLVTQMASRSICTKVT